MAQRGGNNLNSNPVKKVPIHLQSSQNRLILKGAKIVNADGMMDGDVFIEDGAIKEIGRNLIIPGGTRSIDCRGKYILPGGVDPSTHFQMPLMGTKSVDDFYHGTKAAVAGGTTTIIDTVIPAKGESLVDAYGKWRSWAENQVCCDYALRVAVTWWSDKVKLDMDELVKHHGVNSFVIYMADISETDGFMLRDNEIIACLEYCKRLGAVVVIQAENGDMISENLKKVFAAGITGPEGHALARPAEVEEEATLRACVLGGMANCPVYIGPVMSKVAGNFIAEKRQQGSVIFGETAAAALGADGTSYWNTSWRHAAAHVMNPPLRTDPDTPDHLMTLLAKDALQVASSQNCTFSHAQKKMGADDFRRIPAGVNGVEDRMSLIWQKGVHDGKMDPARFVAITSTLAAKIFNMYPQKGAVAVGSDADLVIWDPRKSRTISAKTHHHATDNNIFEGMECFGVPEYVVIKGRVCVDEGQVKVLQGYGNFISMAPFSAFVYNMVRDAEQRKAAKMMAVARDGADGEMVTKVQNGVSHMKIESPKSVSGGVGDIPDHGSSLPASAAPSVVDEMIKSPTGVRNMQESTLDKEPLQEEAAAEPKAVAEKDKGDASPELKSSVRVRAPPGGFSSGFW